MLRDQHDRAERHDLLVVLQLHAAIDCTLAVDDVYA